MSFTNDYSSEDSEWKETKLKTEKAIKQEFGVNLKGKLKYSQKFCDKWLSVFHPWLTRSDEDPSKPFCRACQCRLDCNRCHLQRHESTSKHIRNLEILVNKGEGAARQNLSIRQERSKYYQQRKKFNSSIASPNDLEPGEDFVDGTDADADAETSFQFVPTELASGDHHYTDEITMKQEVSAAAYSHDDPVNNIVIPKQSVVRAGGVSNKKGVKKERMKLLMQIQKDKNDLMVSFKELMGANTSVQQQSPPSSSLKEKNHVDLFFDSVSSSVKALSPKLVAEAKMRVSQLICELELRALTENDANTSCVSTSSAAAAAVVVAAAPEASGTAAYYNHPVTLVHGGTTTQHHHPSEQQYETIS